MTLDGYYNSSPAYSLEEKLSYIFSDVLQDYENLITVTEDRKLKQEAYEGLPVEAIITLFNSGFGQTAEVNMEVVEKARKEKKEFDKLWKFVEKETGLPIVLEVHDRGMVYVDHQSSGIYSNLTIDEIYYLITSDDSVIITSNDNGGSSSIWVPTKIIEKIEGRLGEEELNKLKTIYEHSSWKGDNIRQNILFDNYAYDSKTGKYAGSPYDLGRVVKY